MNENRQCRQRLMLYTDSVTKVKTSQQIQIRRFKKKSG
jgi:hypothetical protein